MKKVLMLIVCCFFCSLMYGGNNLDGVYYDTMGKKIEIFNNTFRYIEPRHLVRTMPSVMVEATYINETDELLKLRDNRSREYIDESLIFEQYQDRNRKKNLTVLFSAPQFSQRYDSEATITVYYITNMSQFFRIKQFKYVSEDGEIKFKLPSKTKIVMISVKPTTYIPSIFEYPNGYYNSYVHYVTPYFDIDDSTNRIKIEIRNLEYSYFVQYVVNGDYVRVVGDKLYWRGRVFEKSYAPEDIRYIEEKESALKK